LRRTANDLRTTFIDSFAPAGTGGLAVLMQGQQRLVFELHLRNFAATELVLGSEGLPYGFIGFIGFTLLGHLCSGHRRTVALTQP